MFEDSKERKLSTEEGHISTTPTEDKCAVVSGAEGLNLI